jgi:UDP-N-acetylglucosamine 1-carboxyvinyltransferase
VDLHLKALEQLGRQHRPARGLRLRDRPARLKGARIEFPFVSVGATEHTLMACVLAEGETVLENAAREPEIGDLADCLNAMGAQVEGAGTSTIRVTGVSKLHGATHSVIPDRIEGAPTRWPRPWPAARSA